MANIIDNSKQNEFIQLYNTAIKYLDNSDYSSALTNLKKCLLVEEQNPDLLYNLALCYHYLGNPEQALELYLKTIAIDDNNWQAHSNVATIYSENFQGEKALIHLIKARQIAPTEIDVINNLTQVLSTSGLIKQALPIWQEAIKNKRITATCFSSFLRCLHFDNYFDHETVFNYHKLWQDFFKINKSQCIAQSNNILSANKKLNIAYVSPDFRFHSVAYFFLPLIRNHDHDKFNIFCYSNSKQTDKMTTLIKSFSPNWLDISALSNQEFINQIKHDMFV